MFNCALIDFFMVFCDSVSGDYCQTKIQFCSKDFNPCHNGAKCVDHSTHYTCECPLGFSGDNCTINNDDCQNHMCQVKTRFIFFFFIRCITHGLCICLRTVVCAWTV